MSNRGTVTPKKEELANIEPANRTSNENGTNALEREENATDPPGIGTPIAIPGRPLNQQGTESAGTRRRERRCPDASGTRGSGSGKYQASSRQSLAGGAPVTRAHGLYPGDAGTVRFLGAAAGVGELFPDFDIAPGTECLDGLTEDELEVLELRF